MQHNDSGRTGQNLTETTLNTATVNSNEFGKLYSVQLDGAVFAQPLYVSSVAIPGSGKHSVVFVATEHDPVERLHALDITTAKEKHIGPVTIQAAAAGTGTGSVNGAVTL